MSGHRAGGYPLAGADHLPPPPGRPGQHPHPLGAARPLDRRGGGFIYQMPRRAKPYVFGGQPGRQGPGPAPAANQPLSPPTDGSPDSPGHGGASAAAPAVAGPRYPRAQPRLCPTARPVCHRPQRQQRTGLPQRCPGHFPRPVDRRGQPRGPPPAVDRGPGQQPRGAGPGAKGMERRKPGARAVAADQAAA